MHKSLTRSVIEAFGDADLTDVEIAAKIQIDAHVVRKCCVDLCNKGRIIVVGSRPHPTQATAKALRIYRRKSGASEQREQHGSDQVHPVMRPKRRVRTRSGSGVIAGRITIGRGSFWGAGLI